MLITDHVFEDSFDGLCKASVPGRQGDRDICDQPPEAHERPKVDPEGTCHLVGCVGKGVHGPEGPHARKSDPPQLGDSLTTEEIREAFEKPIQAARERIMNLSQESIADRVFPKVPERAKIGVPDSWTPYEGGPLIPKPETEHCLGFAMLKIDTRTNVVIVSCSVAGEQAWGLLLTSGQYHLANLVDEHKRDCPNRRVR